MQRFAERDPELGTLLFVGCCLILSDLNNNLIIGLFVVAIFDLVAGAGFAFWLQFFTI